MKKIFYPFVLLLIAFTSKAQYNNTLFYNQFFGNCAAFDLPSEQGLDFHKLNINLIGFQTYVGNSIYSANDAYNMAKYISDGPSNNMLVKNFIPGVLDQVKTNPVLGGVATAYAPLSLGYKVNRKSLDGSTEVFTVTLNQQLISGANFSFGENLLKLRNGNKQFLDQNVNLGPILLNAQSYLATSVGLAFPLLSVGKFANIRAGFNFKYLYGLAAVYSRNGDLFMDTHERYTDYTINMQYNVAYAALKSDETQTVSSGPIDAAGNGLGLDLGASADLFENIHVALGIDNIGSITYRQNVTNYTIDETIRWKGVRVNLFNLDSTKNWFDTLSNSVKFKETNSEFIMPIGTRIVLNGRFGIGKHETRKDIPYYRHSFYLTYIQGLNNMPGNSTIPFVNVAYTLNLKYALQLGTNLGYGGITGTNVGAFIGLRGGSYRFGLGSSNLLGLLQPKLLKGVDLSMNMALAF